MKIKTWEEACNKKGLDPAVLPDVSMLPTEYQKSVIAQYKLNIIADVLNGTWIPDYTDSGQWKYFPWFRVIADKEVCSGSGLSSTLPVAGLRLRVSAFAFALKMKQRQSMQALSS